MVGNFDLVSLKAGKKHFSIGGANMKRNDEDDIWCFQTRNARLKAYPTKCKLTKLLFYKKLTFKLNCYNQEFKNYI